MDSTDDTISPADEVEQVPKRHPKSSPPPLLSVPQEAVPAMVWRVSKEVY